MTFPFAYHARLGTPVPTATWPRPIARWSRCAVSGHPVCLWQPGAASQAVQPVSGHDAPPGADDRLGALLRRHRDLRAA